MNYQGNANQRLLSYGSGRTDGRKDGRIDGHRQNYIPPPSAGDKKYLQHQLNLYYVLIDLKKAFVRAWNAALWATKRKYNISANLARTIKQHYDKGTRAVQINGSMGEWFRTTVGVKQ